MRYVPNVAKRTLAIPIEWCIKFKIACITLCPLPNLLISTQYWNIVPSRTVPSRTLRFPGSNLLLVPRVCTCFGSRSFSVAAPIIWNSLPLDIRNSSTISCFHRQLKTFFYKAAFRPPLVPISPPAQRLGFGRSIADIVFFINSFTYILTYLLTYKYIIDRTWTGHKPCVKSNNGQLVPIGKAIIRLYIKSKLLNWFKKIDKVD